MRNKSSSFGNAHTRKILTLFPWCQQATCLKISQSTSLSPKEVRTSPASPFPTKSPLPGQSPDKNIVLSPNIEISTRKPSSMSFHHFKKYSSYDYDFDCIFNDESTAQDIAENIQFSQNVIEKQNEVCVLAIGGISSGLSDLCQGNKQHQGLFGLMLSSLLEKMFKNNEKEVESLPNNSYTEANRLLLRFMAFYDDKIFDLLNSKSIVTLRQNGNRTTVVGSECFQPLSYYDLMTKLKQIYRQRREEYPESILVIECQLISEDYQQNRYLSLIEWQKSLKRVEGNKTHLHSNQSLLTFNKCIYELYKFSIRSSQTLDQLQANKLWAQFRSSSITKHIKNYLVRNRRLAVIGCISKDESQEEDSFQTLNICKNISKIKFDHLSYSHLDKYQESSPSMGNSIKIPLPGSQQGGFITNPSDEFVNIQKVKKQLKKILDEKKRSSQKQQQKKAINMIRMENRKKKDLSALRYKQQEVRIREDFCSRSRISSLEKSDVHLPSVGKPSQVDSDQYLEELKKQEAKKANEINQLHKEIVERFKTNPDPDFNRSILETEIKMNQKEIIDFIDHKHRIIDILRKEVKEIKKEKCSLSKERPIPTRSTKIRTNKRYTVPNPQFERQESPGIQIQENPEPFKTVEKTTKMAAETKFPSLERLKSMNKQDYLFEKRRINLKKKILKSKEEMNKEYQKAALNFQNYSRVRQKTQ